MQRNVVIVEQGSDHPSLYIDQLEATDLSWVSGMPPAPLPFLCKAKVRYRQPEQPCVIEEITEGRAKVRFLEPQRAVTPRQSIVFYQEDVSVLAGE